MHQRPIRPSSAQQNISHMSDKNVSFHKNPYKQPNLQGVTQYRHSDSEKLFEESLHLKQLVNQLRDENVKLRTRNTNLEKDLQKCTKIIEEVEQTGNMKRFYAKPSTDNQMILSLKSQVKELRGLVDAREHEMLALKKSAKYTKLTEMEVERKMFQDETIRMKQFIDELVQQNIYAQQKEHEQHKLEEMIQQRDNLIKQMQVDLEQFESENKNQQSQLQQLIQAYQDLDKQYIKLDQNMQAKLKQKDKQITELKLQLNRLKEQHDKEKQLLNNKKFSPTLKVHNKQQAQRIQSAKPCIESKPIQLEELSNVITEIKYKLTALQMQSTGIDQLLFNTQDTTTIGQLTDRLCAEPLLLDKAEATKLARFLIEPPGFKAATNISLSQDNGLIRSLFFRVIGFWACYDQVEQRVIELCLSKLFQGMLSQFEKNMGKGTFTKQEFVSQIQKLLSTREIRELEISFLISKIILPSKHLNTLKGEHFVRYLKELSLLEEDEDVTVEDLQQYYDKIGNERGFFYYKQQRSKQEQMIALLEIKQGKIEEPVECINEGSPQKSVQQYLIKSGLVRSHSDPDPMQMKLIQQEVENEDEEEQQQQQQRLNQEEEEYQYDEYHEDYEEEGQENEQNELNNAQIDEQDDKYEEDDDYNINVEGEFEEDNDDENDQWERVENKGNFPVRQDRQIPNSRPTSSYVNKVNRSNSDVKASLQSELHPTKEVHEEEYMEEQFEEEN